MDADFIVPLSPSPSRPPFPVGTKELREFKCNADPYVDETDSNTVANEIPYGDYAASWKHI